MKRQCQAIYFQNKNYGDIRKVFLKKKPLYKEKKFQFNTVR